MPRKAKGPRSNGLHRRNRPTQWQVEQADRRLKAWDLRKQGFSYKEISEQIGVCVSRVHYILKVELKRVQETLDDKILEDVLADLLRVDEVVKTHFSKMSDVKSADIILKAIATRYRVYQAQKDLEATTDEQLTDEERDSAIIGLLDSARARQARQNASSETAQSFQPGVEA
jgi:hypothetical protein